MKTSAQEFKCVMKPSKRFKLKSKTVSLGTGTIVNLPSRAVIVMDDGTVWVARGGNLKGFATLSSLVEDAKKNPMMVIENFSK